MSELANIRSELTHLVSRLTKAASLREGPRRRRLGPVVGKLFGLLRRIRVLERRSRRQGPFWRRLLPKTGTILALSLLLAAVTVRVADPPWVEYLRVNTFDLYQLLSPRPPAEHPVVIVDIDEKSLTWLGQWPWPRTLIARLIDVLGKSGARGVAFDAVFPEMDRMSPRLLADVLPHVDAPTWKKLRAMPSNESVMAKAMRRMPTVLGQVGVNTWLPIEKPRTKVRSSFRVEAGGDPRPFLERYQNLLANVPELEKAAAGVGLFSINSEGDGKVRRVPLLARIGNELRPALILELLRVVYGTNTLITRRNEAGMESVALQIRPELGGGQFIIPTDARGRIWVHFSRPDTYNTPNNSGRLYVSASDVIEGRVPRKRIAGKLVLIGTSAEGLKDMRTTAVAHRMPGVEVHANILESIFSAEAAYRNALETTRQLAEIDGETPAAAVRLAAATVDKKSFFLRYPNYINSAELLLTLVAGLILMVLIPRLRPLFTLAGIASTCAMLIGLSWYLYKEHLLLFDATYPGGTMISIFAILTFSNYAREAAEKRQVRGAFGQYLSPTLVEQLADNPDQLTLGGETKMMSFLFCDVRDFTSISEGYKTDPQALTALMNRLLTPLTDIILAHDGTIDKYMGDCVMAFWNAPIDVADHEACACDTALDMLAARDALNAEMLYEAEPGGADFEPLRVGIGINTGECVVGNMGSAQRFDYSVLGDAVNLAARLETYSKDYGVTIVLGEETARRIESRYALLELDEITVKGKHEAVRIFGLLGDHTLRESDDFAKLNQANDSMLSAYRARDWRTVERLADRCAALPLAPAALYDLYRTRIGEYAAAPPPIDWDGVFVAQHK
jgi:adenylate cyclase